MEILEKQKMILWDREKDIDKQWAKINDEWKQLKSWKEHIDKLQSQYGEMNNKKLAQLNI
jgi:hypothetical protein